MRRCLLSVAVAGILAMVFGSTPANSQIATAEECARMPSQAEELACLRRALEQSRAALHDEVDTVGETKPGKGRTPDVARHAQTAPAPTADRPPQALGAEQIAARQDKAATAPKLEPERIRATVAAAQTDPRGGLTLRLDNGQVWRQAEQPGVPLSLARGKAYPVEILRSGFGGYRMRFPDIGRQIVVKRLQ